MNGGGTFGTCLAQSLESRGLTSASRSDEQADISVDVTADLVEPAAPAPSPTDDAISANPPIGARIEPDGSALLLGTAQPNAQIHLFADGTEIGQTTADSAGDWIFIPDAPFAPGGVAITLGTSIDGGEIEPVDEALAVIIQDDLSSEPIIVASAPTDVTAVLEEMRSTSGAEEPPLEVAALEEEESAGIVSDETATPDADLLTGEQDAGALVEETPDMTAEEPAADEEPPLEVAALEEAPETDVSEGVEPDMIASEENPDDAAEIDVVGEESSTVVAALEPEQVVPDEESIVDTPTIRSTTAPSIDAVEIEPERSYIAGAGENGATIRLFVDDQFVGDSIVDGGRWLVETERSLNLPSQRIRAEMVAPDSDVVTAEVQIDFVIDLPDGQTPDTVTPLILPADQLTPITFPTEAPVIVADATPNAGSADADDEPGVAADTENTASDVTLSADELSDMVLPEVPPVVEIAQAESEPHVDERSGESASNEQTTAIPAAQTADAGIETAEQDLILPDDQLAPVALPTEAPAVPAPTNDDVQVASSESPEDQPNSVTETLILPDDQVNPITMPTEAPVIVIAEAELEAPAIGDESDADDQEAADADPATADAAPTDSAETLTLSDDQLTPITMPTEAPVIVIAEAELEAEASGDDTDADEQEAADAGPAPADAAPTDPAETLILPDDQLAPISMPTEAPVIVIAEAEPETEANGDDTDADEQEADNADLATADAIPTDPAETLILPDDQLAPITMPTEAPVIVTAEAEPEVQASGDAAGAGDQEAVDTDQTTADAAPTGTAETLILPDDQLAPIALPTEAPTIVIADAEPEAQPVGDDSAADSTPAESGPVQDEQKETVQTLVATSIGDPNEGRFASGNVIIRRGDNLWSIARRVYGRGVQYRLIFDANRDAISNPNLIFPGQVFDLPESKADE